MVDNFSDAISRWIMITWVISLGWTLYFYHVFADARIIFWGAFGSLAVMFFLRGMAYFALNGFSYTMDVKALNHWITRHNANLDKAYNNKKEILAKLESGEITLPKINEWRRVGTLASGLARTLSLNA